LRQMSEIRGTSWLSVHPVATEPKMRLFCFPHAGAGALSFHAWREHLPKFVQLCPVQLPGRESRLEEQPHSSLEELVREMTPALRPWLDLPFAIFGHSMGSLIAFEWARALRAQGLCSPEWLFVSGRPAPDSPPDPYPMHRLKNSEFLEEVSRRYDGVSEELSNEPDWIEFFLPILRADIAMVEGYEFREEAPLACPLSVYGGALDRSATYQDLIGWQRNTRAAFDLKIFPGGHFYPVEPMLAAISGVMEGLAVRTDLLRAKEAGTYSLYSE
jgi:medium-chain acyl-[acyl-carrier-protein] hydrolase